MDKQTAGTVVATTKQWWLKVNRKPMRMHALDGAEFPYIIKIEYTVDGKAYRKRKWISAGKPIIPRSRPRQKSCNSVLLTRNKNPFRN